MVYTDISTIINENNKQYHTNLSESFILWKVDKQCSTISVS